jgi:hypothetical protein
VSDDLIGQFWIVCHLRLHLMSLSFFCSRSYENSAASAFC